MKNSILHLIFLIIFTGCGSVSKENPKLYELKSYQFKNIDPKGYKILKTADEMIKNRVIIRGSCWDFVNAVYEKAGFPKQKRVTIAKTSKRGSINPKILKPGDWIYHINLSYRNVEHSAIFVKWIDFKNKKALTISYAGERRKTPARYKIYDLSRIYTVIRPE
ncbi:MAG: hypothetical protein GXO31_08310 [Epsilonproteobacteria bacterium]|nr:hypothetical protein [Campylobacterota bacterium]